MVFSCWNVYLRCWKTWKWYTHTHTPKFEISFFGKTFPSEGHLQEASEGVLFFYRQRLFWFWCSQVAGIPFWCLFFRWFVSRGGCSMVSPWPQWVDLSQYSGTYRRTTIYLTTTLYNYWLGISFFTRKHNPRSSHISWCHILQSPFKRGLYDASEEFVCNEDSMDEMSFGNPVFTPPKTRMHPWKLTWTPKIAMFKGSYSTFSRPSFWVSVLVFGSVSPEKMLVGKTFSP